MRKELTKQDILDLFAKSRQEFIELLKRERAEREKSYEKSRKEREERDKEWEERMKKTDKQIGGIGNSNGDVAEEFFYRGLEAKMELGDMSFDAIEKNVMVKRKKLEGEYDVILSNSNAVAIVEVKYKADPDDVEDLLNRKIPDFKKLFPYYKDFKIYGAIAGLAMPNNTKQSAIENGFFVLTQSGEHIKLLNDKVKCY